MFFREYTKFSSPDEDTTLDTERLGMFFRIFSFDVSFPLLYCHSEVS